MEKLMIYGHTDKYTLGDMVTLNNNGAFNGRKVMIMGEPKKGRFHPYNDYYPVRLYLEDRRFPYDFKVLGYHLL